MLEDFHFLRPAWLFLMPLLGLIVWSWIRRTQQGSGWEKLVDDSLLSVLMDDSHRRSGKNIAWWMSLVVVLSALALAGPAWEKLPQNVERKEDTLVILLDLSLSMLAEDENPSRVGRARQKIADVLRTRQEGQTALIAYAGDAHAVVPLTDDTATIENLLFSLSPEMMPVFGSNPDHAPTLAAELFANSGYLQGRILMVTDGIDDISSVTRHRSAAFPISIIGIGTESGGPIPLDRLRQPGRFLQTQEGNRVIAQLDEPRLQEVATLSFGKYARAVVGDADIFHALSTPLPTEDDTIEVEREFDTWYDQGYWLALALIPLLLIAFRRGVLAGLVLVLALPLLDPPPVIAAPAAPPPVATLGDFWQSLWQRSDQRAYDKLRHGQPEYAAALFDDPDWRAVAQYRSGDYGGALMGFSTNDATPSVYNQGNALARLGEYESAIAAYEQVLAREPEHEDALHNKALVERLLQEKQDAEQQQDQDQQSQANNDNSESQQDDQQQQQEDSQQEQENQQNQQQQQDQQQSQEDQQQGQQQEMAEVEDEASRDEKQEALEQWLRRVPDDPGGLLRRKFSHETKQRLRRGEYENRQGDKLW